MATRIGVESTFIDTGLGKLMKDLHDLARLSTTIGYHEPTPVTDTPSLTVPQLAAIQEYGTKNIPARPFIRNGAKEAAGELEDVAAEVIGDLINDGVSSPVRTMAKIGDVAAGRVLEQLMTTSTWAAPNAPSTIRKKGGDIPLFAKHGQLRSELKYAVMDKDSQLLLEKPSP